MSANHLVDKVKEKIAGNPEMERVLRGHWDSVMYECVDRHGTAHLHGPMSPELSGKEAMLRLGVYERLFKVTRWPTGRPDLAHCIQQMEIAKI